MAGKPSVTVAGEYNGYAMGEMLKLIFSNNAFSVDDKHDLGTGNTAPYVFSFINPTVAAPQFRIAQTKYNWGTWGSVGSSDFNFWDTSNGWNLKDGPDTLSNPKNPYAIINARVLNDTSLEVEETPYLLAADYDSGDDTGTLFKSNVTILEMSGDSYGPVATWDYPVALPTGYYAHCQDLIMALHQQTVDGNPVLVPRYFALFSISNSNFSSYQDSVVYELEFEVINGTPTISTVGTPRTVGKNAMAIAPFYVGGNKQNLILTFPCIGGSQVVGGQAGSTLKLIFANVAGTMGTPVDTFQKPTGMDFRSVAYAQDGTAYILCGAQATGMTDFQWALYQTTTTAIVTAATQHGTLPAPINPVSPNPPVDYDSYFWSLGMCQPEGSNDEYLIFAKGNVPQSGGYLSKDAILYLKKGDPWANAQTIDATALAISGSYFAINSIDISVAGGGIASLRSAAAPASARAAANFRAVNAMKAGRKMLEEKKK